MIVERDKGRSKVGSVVVKHAKGGASDKRFYVRRGNGSNSPPFFLTYIHMDGGVTAFFPAKRP